MTSTATADAIVERDGQVLTVTINRPDQRNGMTLPAGEIIAAAVDELDSDPELYVAIITGAGKSFCAGMDLKRFLAGERPSIPGRGFGGITQRPPHKPLIAAVEGHALAGGFEMVLACDLVVAGQSATFGLPEVRRGLVARAGGLIRLPRRLPRAIALEMILTGESMAAERAATFGLVNRVVPDGQALAVAKELAGTIAANAPLAVAGSKRGVRESAELPAGGWVTPPD